ncbi:MAG: SDR family NAD(P)-dependent oxidoreductase [Chloroflexi bacterium]|nr:SDR family NAD(P)-dependent oxidoreductase [Chloroflexota bacterium]
MALNGKVALVAGASRGIGADIAKYLGAAGAKVAVAARTEVVQDKRLPGTIHSVVEEIRAKGGTALPVVLNLRDPDSIRAAVKQVADEWGQIDILVNNAAIFVPGNLETVQERHIELSFQVNLKGVILTMKEALPYMKKAGGGHIINISSRGALYPGPGPYDTSRKPGGDIFYGAEKAAIERFSQQQAWLLQDDNIAVNVLSPQGRIKTPGNVFFQNDPNNPDLEFESADFMGKATVWICEQQAMQFTGNVVYDQDLCKEKKL